ncbi:hypothetical protein Tco_1568337 [Tanacetum coccineum]
MEQITWQPESTVIIDSFHDSKTEKLLAVIPDMRKEMAPPTVSTVHKVLPRVHDEHFNDDLHNLNEDGWLSFSPDHACLYTGKL